MIWGLVQTGVVAVIGGVIAGIINTAILNVRVKRSEARIDALEAAAAANAESLRVADTDRQACELRASRLYATGDEMTTVIANNSQMFNTVFEKLDEVRGELGSQIQDVQRDLSAKVGHTHGRIDDLSKHVHELRGRDGGRQSGGTAS
jgi:hypothetical protein